jgi:hypothetical protein
VRRAFERHRDLRRVAGRSVVRRLARVSGRRVAGGGRVIARAAVARQRRSPAAGAAVALRVLQIASRLVGAVVITVAVPTTAARLAAQTLAK